MVISYYGLTCFKIQSGSTVIAIDPFSKEAGLTPPRFEANIVLKTTPDNLSTYSIAGAPFVCAVPGEYEIGGTTITGVNSNGSTSYVLELDGVRIAHLGKMRDKEVFNNISENFEKIDICILPVGGKELAGAEGAAWLASQIEPRIIIPMYYAISGIKEKLGKLDAFLKEVEEKPEKTDKLTIKKSGLPQGEQKVVIIAPQGNSNVTS